MKNVAILGRSFVLLAVAACATSVLGAGVSLEYIKHRTLQNLAPSPSKFTGHYLGIDTAGKSHASADAGSHWELKKAFWKERGYTTYTIIQRGNNRFNGKYLALDKATGALKFSNTEIPTARWLIRSVGKYQGWDAVTIQSLAETGTYDMQFLSLDDATGEIRLTATAGPSANWHLADAPYLPAESLFP